MTMARPKTKSFQTETKQLLQLMIHSLYSNKEIFLRDQEHRHLVKSLRIDINEIVFITDGKGIGRLVGGNLSLIASLIGTSYQILTKGKILVLEDIEEPIRKIERFLCQLEQAHLFNDLAGLILGIWTECEVKELLPIFKKYFSSKNYPVMYGFRTGHISNQVSLPLNCLVEIDTNSKSVKLLDNCVAI